jgi:alpha-L-fucosidase
MEVAELSRADGGKVGIWSDDSVYQQHWAVTPTGDGYYHLTNRLSGLSLNVDGASTANGAGIEQETYNRATHQQWQIIAV